MTQDDTGSIGQAIRRIRKNKHISLQALSSASGVAIGMLSQIERDLGNPSLKTLMRIQQALDVPLSALFDADGEADAKISQDDLAHHVRHATSRRAVQFGTPLMTKEMLSPPAGQRLQFMVLNIQPGGTSGPSPLSYPAEKGGLVLEGAFELTLAGKVLQLRAGDSFQFDGATPHTFSNPYEEPASLMWIIAHEPAAGRHL
ncbi:cupin domain-containing protein [Bordetella sp. 15P40C-2]|uniref:cupin domain-containing protein n=1 Tax=Bordetella sp. 15P40C-2 TaxID=2572246 RepID=UPI00132BE92A|nr:cupin domain-containing protein [Bordetella sp. 15P40C-2]MVW70872.1 cupin domain-containing protein [Bordetella sp. 15P40C-2]